MRRAKNWTQLVRKYIAKTTETTAIQLNPDGSGSEMTGGFCDASA
jgi:hypothetical protein